MDLVDLVDFVRRHLYKYVAGLLVSYIGLCCFSLSCYVCFSLCACVLSCCARAFETKCMNRKLCIKGPGTHVKK